MVKVDSVSGGESRQDEALGAMEFVNSGEGGEMRMELGEDVAGREGEVDETVGEVEGGAEEGQARVSRIEESVNSVQDEEMNLNKDTADKGGGGVDENNADESFVEDSENQVEVVEKVFHLIYGVNLRYFSQIVFSNEICSISQSLTLSSQ